ncbi:unnamed protein product [Lupinus luteus]|uniref:60S ribosomal protein L18a-like protein n=1 Tax=Lupinus luteus TaxID=3873 RepID=A0AAV1YBE3_LUPLU
MDKDARMEENVSLRNNGELGRAASDMHLDLLRPSARNNTISKAGQANAVGNGRGKYSLIRDPEDFQVGIYDIPLPCFGCGVGWFSFLFGFLCPPMWYYATFLYFGNYYRKDPRERAGLGASAIAALLCSVALLIIASVLLLRSRSLQL